MTTVFYAPPEAFIEGVVTLPEEEARHAVRVLRHGVGDELVIVDGAGGRHRVRLTEAGKRGARGKVMATEHEVGEWRAPLAVGLAVLKNTARFETFAEKAAELGVTEIIPLATERTERTRLKAERLHSVLVAAMKQSGRSRLPTVHQLQPLEEVITNKRQGLRLLCHESARAEDSLWNRLQGVEEGGGVTVLVGPEGGFTEEEVAAAASAGWAVSSLGPRRLRAETAAIAAAAAAMLHATR